MKTLKLFFKLLLYNYFITLTGEILVRLILVLQRVLIIFANINIVKTRLIEKSLKLIHVIILKRRFAKINLKNFKIFLTEGFFR